MLFEPSSFLVASSGCLAPSVSSSVSSSVSPSVSPSSISSNGRGSSLFLSSSSSSSLCCRCVFGSVSGFELSLFSFGVCSFMIRVWSSSESRERSCSVSPSSPGGVVSVVDMDVSVCIFPSRSSVCVSSSYVLSVSVSVLFAVSPSVLVGVSVGVLCAGKDKFCSYSILLLCISCASVCSKALVRFSFLCGVCCGDVGDVACLLPGDWKAPPIS